MRTAIPRMTLSRSSLFAASVLGVSLLVGCGNAEMDEGWEPVSPQAIDGNDAPLAPLSALKADAPADSSIAFEGKADVVLPKSADVMSIQTVVKNQASRGVCSIFSTLGLVESLYKKAGMTNPDFSEQYLQWSVKFQVKAFTNTSGSSDYYNLKAVSTYGVVAEDKWPYETTQWDASKDPSCTGTGDGLPTICYTNGTPPATATSATKYKLPAGRWVSTSSIKNVIFEKKQGVVVGLDFFYQAWNHRRSALPVSSSYFQKGYVLYPNAEDQTASAKQPAGHSVQLVGYDDNLEIQAMDKDGRPAVDAAGNPIKQKGFFLFKNSWGTTNFGVSNSKAPGYGWISYRYVQEYGSVYTADPPKLP
ncbi:MAG: C1 family peptidase [Myxococcales bacterium]|nr:C1 family peptidase [Myxococcales bacterium]